MADEERRDETPAEQPVEPRHESAGEHDDAGAPGDAAEALLRAAQDAVDAAADDDAPGSEAGKLSEQDIEAIMAAQLAQSAAGDSASGGVPFQPPSFEGSGRPRAAEPLDLLSDVNLNVKIELGRTRMVVEDVLKLGEGAVIELDKLAGDPVDVYVNERLVARGEVLILSDNFCVRVNEIINSEGGSAKSA
ncbi:MAG: flagellar motor switch protein FliN [Phycisphaerales bacterium JB037]